MADYDRIMKALRNAHEAGDTAAAQRLAKMAREARQPSASAAISSTDRQFAAQGILERNRRLAREAGVDLPTQSGREADAIAEQNMARASMGRGQAALTSFTQGATLGFSDEIIGALGGNADVARAQQEQAQTAYPGQSFAAQTAGAVTTGLAVPGATTVRGAALTGAGFGAVDAAGNAEGSAVERIDDAAIGGATGLLFGGMTAALAKGTSNAVRATFQRAEKRPTVQALKSAKNAAYAAVKRSGFEFDSNEMTALAQRIGRRAELADLSEVADPHSRAVLSQFQNRADKTVSLNRLDKIRQNVWSRYNRSEEPFLLDVISEIDETIARNAQGNDLMKAARAANAKFAKAELLENAFNKAQRQTAATGSGGNILNKYRQAINSIIDKPHERKFFSAEELALMESFVMGETMENTLRRAGKLAPGGNGLMTALNVYAAAIDPTMLAITAASSAAKETADRSAMRGSERILDAVSTGVIRQPTAQPNLTPFAVGGAAGGNELIR